MNKTLLVLLALLLAISISVVGCTGNITGHSLTMAVDPIGAGTTTPSGTSSHAANAMIDIEAVEAEGYWFSHWTATAGTFADATAAQTTFTMPAQDVTVTANFALEIRDWYDLNAIRNNLAGSYVLINDLNSTTTGYTELASPTANEGKGWEPIKPEIAFNGTLDGQGYQIRDLFVYRPEESYVGLFALLNEGGGIKDIGVVNADVTGYSGVGGLVGFNLGTVSNSYSTGSVTGNSSVGGLVGANYGGTVSNSYSTGNVTGGVWVGVLVGINYDGASVHKSYSSGIVTGAMLVGGLVGVNYGGNAVSNSYSSSNVTGGDYVGGLVGANQGTVSNSYSSGSVTGNSSVGGLVGYNEGAVNNSFWDTETSGRNVSAGGTGKTTAEMQAFATFSGVGWDINTVANPSVRDLAYIWNIVDDLTYPFLSWQP